MENATNGLLMAGSVLIGVIILSLFVYMFASMGNVAKDFQGEIDSTTVRNFNEPFEKYIGREDLEPYDLVTVYNMVQNINNKDVFHIELIGVTAEKVNIDNIDTFLATGDKYRYKCEADYSTETMRIYRIIFKPVLKESSNS